MPLYDMYCPDCDTTFENLVMTYEEMHTEPCPLCRHLLQHKPAGFRFEVKDSQRAHRQKMEARFKKRAKRIDREFTPQQRERFEAWCISRGCRRYY